MLRNNYNTSFFLQLVFVAEDFALQFLAGDDIVHIAHIVFQLPQFFALDLPAAHIHRTAGNALAGPHIGDDGESQLLQLLILNVQILVYIQGWK